MADPHVIAVVGAKGGCGATLLTASIAANISATRSVCAIDLDFARGDLAGMLDLDLPRSLPELMDSVTDATLLQGCAVRHQDGFSVLGQPRDMSQLVRPTRAEVKALITVARGAWEVLVLDVGSRMDEAFVAAVTEADQVLLVSTRDVLAFRNLVRLRALLVERLAVPADRLRVVVNMLPGRRAAAVDELADLAGLKIAANLRLDDDAANRAIAAGRVVHSIAPRSPLAQDLEAFWRKAFPVAETPPQRWHLPWIGVAP